MQPCLHDDWFLKYEEDAVFKVKGRLYHPALRLFRESAARVGVARTREIAKYLCQFENYFTNELQFRRWLNTVSYREALRVLLQLEPIEMALQESSSNQRVELSRDQRAVIHWSYIDQLTEYEIARLLNLETSNRLLFDRAAARERMIDSYKHLCQIILRRYRSADADEAERFTDCSRIFPPPPTLSGDFDIRLEQGLTS